MPTAESALFSLHQHPNGDPCLSPEFLVTPRDKENQILKPTAHIQIPHCMIFLLSNQDDWECTKQPCMIICFLVLPAGRVIHLH